MPPCPRPACSAASVEASGPETDDPGMEMFALREMVNAPLPPPEEGRAENLLFPFLPLASRSVVPKTSTKEQFPLSLGPQRGRGVVNESVARGAWFSEVCSGRKTQETAVSKWVKCKMRNTCV